MTNGVVSFVVSGLLNYTAIGLVIAIVVGVVVGLIVGALVRSISTTILKAIIGSFFGTMLVAILPIFSKPELIGSSPYGGITILQMAIVLVPIGSIGGALVGGLSRLKLNHPRHQKGLLIALAVTYVVIASVTYGRIHHYCERSLPSSYTPDVCSSTRI